jgi:hypothetical protein
VASAMWQRITGRIEVLDDIVRVEIDLPWIMQVLRDTIAKQVRGRGLALLERPRARRKRYLAIRPSGARSGVVAIPCPRKFALSSILRPRRSRRD